MNELSLRIDGSAYTGFKEVALLKSIEQGPWQFELATAPQHNDNPRFIIEDGMLCQAFVGDELALTGFVDDVNIDYDATTHEAQVTGRSRVGDLVDCSMQGQQMKAGQSLLAIALAFCEPFNITVNVDASAFEAANEPFATLDQSLDAGQPVWEFLESLARMRAVLLVSNAAGGLTITRAGKVWSQTPLVLGHNILSAKSHRSHRTLFSEYNVNAQQPLLTNNNEDNSQITATVPGQARRFRPQVLHSDNPGDRAACLARASWQQRVNWGRSQRQTYTVSGWHQDNGKLWQPGLLVPVTDPFCRLKNAPLLITQTRLQQRQATGQTTELTLMPKEAFELMASAIDAVEGLA